MQERSEASIAHYSGLVHRFNESRHGGRQQFNLREFSLANFVLTFKHVTILQNAAISWNSWLKSLVLILGKIFTKGFQNQSQS